MWKLYYFYNNFTSSLIYVSHRHPPSLQYLDPFHTGSASRTHLHGGLYQIIFQMHENSIKQQSAIICLLANRQSTLVQLCFAELCTTAQRIQMFHYEISSDTLGSSTTAQKMGCTMCTALNILAHAF